MAGNPRLVTALVVSGLLLGQGCAERLPTTTRPDPVPLTVTVLTVGTPVSTLVVTVTAADFSQPLLFNLTVVNGVASGTIKIPPGAARTIAVTAYDDGGNITHDGQATVDVRPGQNPPVNIKLTPRAGHVPIVVTFGSFAVVVSPAQATIDVTASTVLQLSVQVTGADGQPIANPDVAWATAQPATATVSPSGLITGVANGVVMIAATYGGVVGFSTITVSGFGTATVCASWTWTPSTVDPCAAQPAVPNAALSLLAPGSYTYNTDDGSLAQPDGSSLNLSSVLVPQPGAGTVRVLALPSFTLGAGSVLRVNGSNPLVLLVAGNATVAGVIDVSAFGHAPGPGGNDPSCPPAPAGTTAPVLGGGAAGGGSGAGFGAPGGSGGAGTQNVAGGAAQSENGSPDLSPLRGGCSGGPGGGNLVLNPTPHETLGGLGGGGGGAVQIAARDNLIVTGEVRSAGGGGRVGSDSRNGGGGGGSGGAILLESNDVFVGPSAHICANGGSGGEGLDLQSLSGSIGQDGTCEITAATTFDFNPYGGNGGAGGTAISAAQDGGPGAPAAAGVAGGGGGGGGGVGRVRVRGVTTTNIDASAVVTPTPAQ